MIKWIKQHQKESQKTKYGLFSNIKYMNQLMWKYNKSLTISSISLIPIAILSYIILIYLPPTILHYLETDNNLLLICEVILTIVLIQLLVKLIENYLKIVRSDSEHFILMRMEYQLLSKEYDMDYFLQLDSDIEKMKIKANEACQNNHSSGVKFQSVFADIMINAISFLLFGTMIAVLNPLLVAILIVCCSVNYFAKKHEQDKTYQNSEQRWLYNKKMGYMKYNVVNDYNCGKDIRLYRMGEFLHELYISILNGLAYENKRVENRASKTSLINFITVAIRDGAAYIYLIIQAVNHQIDASQFVLYFTAVTQVSSFISQILDSWSSLYAGSRQVSDYREFIGLEDAFNRGKGIPIPNSAMEIEFVNVSFRYPRSEQYILRNVSLKIYPKEKIALVGLNGAGKTTLTYLMCGMLLPTEGEILLNGHPLKEYNRDELYSAFSIVPQEYNILPLTIAENIAIDSKDNIDISRVNNCIEMAGLRKKVNALPQGIWTYLNKQVNEKGVELSGGEIQKLLLARAFYHQKSALILDEPTAALDPISEDEMYRKYNDMAKDITSIFISHRLASTLFCDRILYLEDATIMEQGSHQELMKKKGKYYELYLVQSKYYIDGENTLNEEKIS